MKIVAVPPIATEIDQRIGEMLGAGTPIATVIQTMRGLGLNKIASIKLLRDHAGMTISEAKDLVHLSPAWDDCRESDDRLHESAYQATKALGFVEEGDTPTM
jgi:ribosomal protein L7/L12